jgi:hypothetical protein
MMKGVLQASSNDEHGRFSSSCSPQINRIIAKVEE